MPYSIAIGPLGTLLTLEIASLRGSPVDVSYAMSAGSAVGIIAPLMWGFLLDRYGGRRVLALGFLGTSIFMLALTYVNAIPQISLFYAAASLFSSAVGISTSLMVISSSSKDKWSEGYSRLNFISSLGYLIGDLAAAALSSILSIRLIILLMGLLPTASMAWLMLTMPSEGKVIRRSGGYRQIKRVMNTGDLAYVLTLYTALIVFYISSGIFNTLYPYGLREGGLSKTWVMLIISAGLGVQILGFRVAPRIIRRLGGDAKAASRSLILRSLSYALIGFTSSTPSSLVVTGLTLYPLAAGIAFSTFYTASSIMVFEKFNHGEEGKGIGVYNVVTGSAYLTGSFASGYLASAIGIGQSYIVAGVMLLGSAYLFNRVSERTTSMLEVARLRSEG